MRLFYRRDSTDNRLLWGKTQSDYKDKELKGSDMEQFVL